MSRTVLDFGSGFGQKSAMFTNLAQIRLRPKCSRISVLADLQNGAYKYYNVPYFN